MNSKTNDMREMNDKLAWSANCLKFLAEIIHGESTGRSSGLQDKSFQNLKDNFEMLSKEFGGISEKDEADEFIKWMDDFKANDPIGFGNITKYNKYEFLLLSYRHQI